MNVVDSSGWLEYLADGPNAAFFAGPVEDVGRLLVPTICVLEVFRRVLQQRDEAAALEAVALMLQGTLVDLDLDVAMTAGRLGVDLKLPLTDSVVLATARTRGAVVWTQDADFDGLPGVKFTKKQPR